MTEVISIGNLKQDLYRRPVGWDYVTLEIPGLEDLVSVYIRMAERGHIQLLFNAPTDIRISRKQLGEGGPRKL